MIPISVCIITKNEAERLEQCLQTLQPYPFEIVVVDTGSTDTSKETARKYTDKVYEFSWIDDFSAARNYAAKCASHDMIFSIDTDELIRSLDWDALQSIIADNPKGIGCIRHLDYFETDSETKCYDKMLERIYNRKYYHYERPIHEAIVPMTAISCKSYETSVTVDHIGYLGNKDTLRHKAERNLALLKKELQRTPDDPYTYFQVGQSYMLLRDHEHACDYFREAIARNPSPSDSYTRMLVNNYGNVLIDLDRPEEAIGLLSYYEYYDNNIDYLCMIGLSYMLVGQPLRALPEFVKALTAPTSDSSDPRIPSYYIGYLYEYFGKKDIARTHYLNCGDYAPAVEALTRLESQI
ncbi:glycosyltransferase [bacterium 0.1xD8-71]|nr:glycosyltransferase [bacterium 0.1xD8-71]